MIKQTFQWTLCEVNTGIIVRLIPVSGKRKTSRINSKRKKGGKVLFGLSWGNNLFKMFCFYLVLNIK